MPDCLTMVTRTPKGVAGHHLLSPSDGQCLCNRRYLGVPRAAATAASGDTTGIWRDGPKSRTSPMGRAAVQTPLFCFNA